MPYFNCNLHRCNLISRKKKQKYVMSWMQLIVDPEGIDLLNKRGMKGGEKNFFEEEQTMLNMSISSSFKLVTQEPRMDHKVFVAAVMIGC